VGSLHVGLDGWERGDPMACAMLESASPALRQLQLCTSLVHVAVKRPAGRKYACHEIAAIYWLQPTAGCHRW
jgi:hypothetical protein